MKWNIVADSSCDYTKLKHPNEDITFNTVPFIINVGEEEYIDDENLDKEKMITAMELCKEASQTACPSPAIWEKEFDKEGYVFGVTISKNLSGSYNSASTGRNMLLEEQPDKKVHIVDSLATGPTEILIIDKLQEYIEAGFSFEEIVEKIEAYRDQIKIVFALCSFNNLTKNGRMNKFAGFVASRLGFWGIGIATPEGRIAMKSKTRGAQKAIIKIVDDLEERGIPKEKVIITHCFNQTAAEAIDKEIKRRWPDTIVEILDTRGLDGYYAERHGLIISYC